MYNFIIEMMSYETTLIILRLLSAYFVSLLGSMSRELSWAIKSDDRKVHGTRMLINTLPGMFMGAYIIDVFSVGGNSVYLALFMVYWLGFIGENIHSYLRKTGLGGFIKFLVNFKKTFDEVANEFDDTNKPEKDDE